jgi:hypothetical protein
MSILMYFPADFSENEFNTNYKPCLGNFSKECAENKKIYERVKPLDNLNKNIILSPRQLSTSRCNLEEYNRQCYLFPPKTEEIINKYGNGLDTKYCHQNFVNIDDETFLFNINKKYRQNYEGNIRTTISPMMNDMKNGNVSYINESQDLLLGDYKLGQFINEKTKRRDIVPDQ